MIRAAGILAISALGHVLLLHRTDGQGWAFPGGHIEEDESAEEAARREFEEELGVKFKGDLSPWTRRCRPGAPGGEDVDFITLLGRVEKEFVPTLEKEHDGYQWVDIEFARGAAGLHPGVPIALQRFTMDELGIAKAMVAGELTSPQRYGNLLLVAMRITGTGASYRHEHKEFVWRDSALYLTPEFLERCNGLPVVLEHSTGLMLDTEEFRERIVGTVFLPYIKREVEEVWGITKILDMEAAALLEKKRLSTSPAVVFLGVSTGTKHEMANGTVLLVEGRPSLLDHLALCPLGVWDKGGPPTGVDSIDSRADLESNGDDPMDTVLRKLKVNELVRLASRL